MAKRHFLSFNDIKRGEVERVLDLAFELKSDPKPELAGKSLAMIFEKPSTRTRVSFETGMFKLGGAALYLSTNDLQLGRGETILDTARVLCRYNDIIMARVFKHSTLEELAEGSTSPVINALSDKYHPCQALADLMTIKETFKKLEGLTLAFIGDGNNNVTHSLMIACTKMGMNVIVACPKKYGPKKEIIDMAKRNAEIFNCSVEVTDDAVAAAKKADVIYSDVFVSMGNEAETKARLKDLAPYQVNEKLVKDAKKNYIFMHCLPAHRGQEATDGVIDSRNSVVFRQAENRMHAQMALMVFLLKGL